MSYTKVSSDPIYDDKSPIEINEKVKVISKDYVKWSSDMKSYYSTDDSKFSHATLISKTVIEDNPEGAGRGSLMEYEISLHDVHDLPSPTIFSSRSSNPEFYFKVEKKKGKGPLHKLTKMLGLSSSTSRRGGKKSRNKKYKKKSRKNYRKSKNLY